MGHPLLSEPVLVVEDDRKTASLVALYLEKEGFQTVIAHDGQQGLNLAQRHPPGFVILDLMMPAVDGWEICRRLRSSSGVPILILSAKEEEMERVLGLSLGADDYVVKPFSPRELVARVKAILRRTIPHARNDKVFISHDGISLDQEKRKVMLHGLPVFLTTYEFKLLHVLMTSPGRVFTRDELLNRLYPRGEAVIDRVIDVHIGKLRQKLEANASRPSRILTVRGVGYQLAETHV